MRYRQILQQGDPSFASISGHFEALLKRLKMQPEIQRRRAEKSSKRIKLGEPFLYHGCWQVPQQPFFCPDRRYICKQVKGLAKFGRQLWECHQASHKRAIIGTQWQWESAASASQ